ncbi:hypothetical protein PJF56_01295 [Roseofilum sp. BLCC_M91]|uniref:Chromosome segregation ATPase n=1 Tax=Roseofilum halophilum BLCC-M91 TaxID=3022259 RepID=A0ABT7BE99_9CYAN|nr:hypothetical protein [Roseofilum halophilum]MDJ1177489.1 hypothetical protein [Roseofilum halophilum BLCC-M91]
MTYSEKSTAMLYLAQVQTEQFLGKAGLRVLAAQESETTWKLATQEEIIPCTDPETWTQNQLVLVELTENRQILSISDAKDWVLKLIEQYLSVGITPEFLQSEIERAEQWRQDLTLQSQEVARGRLEVEARHAQLQIVEEKLNKEKVQLDEEKQALQEQRQHAEEPDEEDELSPET